MERFLISYDSLQCINCKNSVQYVHVLFCQFLKELYIKPVFASKYCIFVNEHFCY